MINLNYDLNRTEHERLMEAVAKLASNCEGTSCTNCVLHYLKVYNTEDGVELTECCDIAEYIQSRIEKTSLKPCKLCGDTPHEYCIDNLTDGFVLTHYCKRIRRSESRLERVITVYGDTREEVIDIWNAGPDDNNNTEEE